MGFVLVLGTSPQSLTGAALTVPPLKGLDGLAIQAWHRSP